MFGHLCCKTWRAAVPLAALAGVLSCQNTTVVEEDAPPASGDHYVRFRVPDSSTIPDSLWYRGHQDSGSKSFSVQTSDLSIRFFAPLHVMEGRDTLQIHSYRMGLHLGTTYAGLFQFMEFAGVRTVRTPADSLAIDLLRRYDSLRKANPADFKDTSAIGRRDAFQKVVAQLVFQGHPAIAAYKRLAPVGLDTAKVNRQILMMAANSGLTLGEVVRRWNMGLDYGAAAMALNVLGMDSASLNPFRVEESLALDTLHLGEAPMGLMGKIRGKKGIASVKFSIESDSVDKTERFVLADLPDPKGHPELLDFAGHAAFQPRSGTAVGKYTLRVKVSDSLANTQIFSASFVVAGALDHVGPSLGVVSPTSSLVRDFNDSQLVVRVEARDGSGIQWVKIGGKDAHMATDGIWFDTLVVPVSATSVSVSIQARDGVGNTSDTAIQVRRNEAPKPTAPRLTLVGPANGALVPFDSTGVWVEWKAQTDFGKIEGVTVDGKDARQEGDVWRLRVSLSPDGKLVILPVRAVSSVGLSVTEFVSVARAKDEEKPTASRVAGTQDRRVVFDTSSVEVGWTAWDNDRIAKAWIQDSLVGSDATGYRHRVKLDLGTQWIRFRAVDPAGNDVRDSVSVERQMDTVKAVTFSDTNGKLRSGSFWVKLTCATPGATIRYTLDGSEPTDRSLKFVDSLLVDTTITLRARGYANDREPGAIASQIYRIALALEVSAGSSHSLVRMSDGSVWGFGDNNCNAFATSIGCGRSMMEPLPKPIQLEDDSVVQVSAMANQSFWIKKDQSLWAIGGLESEGLGAGTAMGLPAVSRITGGVSKVRNFGNSTFILKSDGSLWGTGSNMFGQLGMGDMNTTDMFVKVQEGVTDMGGGNGCGYFTKVDKSLWATGRCAYLKVDSKVPQKVLDSVSMIPSFSGGNLIIARMDGSVWGAGENSSGELGLGHANPVEGFVPLDFFKGIAIKKISMGYGHVLILDSNGTVFGVGRNVIGELGNSGLGSRLLSPLNVFSGISDVSAGSGFSLLLAMDGTVWSVGTNISGQLGRGGVAEREGLGRVRF